MNGSTDGMPPFRASGNDCHDGTRTETESDSDEAPVEYQATGDERLSEAVISAVATAEDSDPMALDPPLYDAIDPDALDALFQSPRVAGRMAFRYHGRTVTVHANRRVVVR